jgi:hypothetical protein
MMKKNQLIVQMKISEKQIMQLIQIAQTYLNRNDLSDNNRTAIGQLLIDIVKQQSDELKDIE